MKDTLTVGLPLYNSKSKYKSALESLVKQKEIDFKWELVIIEESNSNSVGRLKIFRYNKQLMSVGCNRIFHVPIKKKMPLNIKWHKISKLADISSKCVILQSDSNYSDLTRLKKTYDSFNNGVECVKSKDGLAIKTDILRIGVIDDLVGKVSTLKVKNI